MIKNITIPAALALALSLTGCHNNDTPAPAGPASLVLMAAVYDIDAESTSIWHAGQAFGVYMLKNGNTPIASNVRHLADNRGVTGYLVPEKNAILFPADGNPVDIAAYYPFDEAAVANGHQTTITVRENMAADAYLWSAVKNASGTNPRVTLGLKSQLAQINARILNDDPAIARIVARIEGAPRSCNFDIISGRYTGTPDCSTPIGMTVKVLEGNFDLTAIVAATQCAECGPSLEVTALDKSGREIRKYPSIALGEMLGLENGRSFEPNTIYTLAGRLSQETISLQFTGSSPICILRWNTDPDEEFGTIIKK